MTTKKTVTPVSTTAKNSTAKSVVEKKTVKNSTTKPAVEKKTVKNTDAKNVIEKSTQKKPAPVKKTYQLGRDTWKTSYPIVDIAAQDFVPWWVRPALSTKLPEEDKFSYAVAYYLLRDLCPDYTDHTCQELYDMLKTYVANHPDTVIAKWWGKEITPAKERDLTARIWWCMATSLKTLDAAAEKQAAGKANALQAKEEKIASQKAAVQSIAKAVLEEASAGADAITNDAPVQ